MDKSTQSGFNHTYTLTSAFQVRRERGSGTVMSASKTSRKQSHERFRQAGISKTTMVTEHSNTRNISGRGTDLSRRYTHVPFKAGLYTGDTSIMRCTNSIHLLVTLNGEAIISLSTRRARKIMHAMKLMPLKI